MAAMTMRHVIGAPREKVFAMFSDFPHAAKNVSAITNMEILTDGPVDVGMKFRETRLVFKREATETMEITEFVCPEKYAVEATSCGCHFKTTMTFNEHADGTEVVTAFESKPLTLFAKVFSILGPVMLGPMKKCIEKDVVDLRTILESPESQQGD